MTPTITAFESSPDRGQGLEVREYTELAELIGRIAAGGQRMAAE